MNYWDYNSGAQTTCGRCGWEGAADQGGIEAFGELFEVNCPKCDGRLFLVSYPTAQETKAAAEAGSARAAREQRKRSAVEDRHDRMRSQQLAGPSSLPYLPSGPVSLTWDLEYVGSEREAWTVLRAGKIELWREPAFWEDIDRFHEITAILVKRYGTRLTGVEPTPNGGLYLLGDRLKSIDEVDAVNEKLRAAHAWGGSG